MSEDSVVPVFRLLPEAIVLGRHVGNGDTVSSLNRLVPVGE